MALTSGKKLHILGFYSELLTDSFNFTVGVSALLLAGLAPAVAATDHHNITPVFLICRLRARHQLLPQLRIIQ
jgi:hypothetical protein